MMPRCGGTDSRLLAPGHYEYTSRTLVNVAPAGAQGNVADGRIYYDRSFNPTGNDRFNTKAIKQMSELAALRPLGLPPRPKSA